MKLSALFIALTMTVGLMATSAAAADGVSGVVQDFFEWSVNAQRETGDAFWRAIYGDSWNPDGGFSDGVGADRADLVEKYGSYTDAMQAELSSTTLVNGDAVRIYFDFISISQAYKAVVNSEVYETPWLMVNFNATSADSYVRTVWSAKSAPFAGHAKGNVRFIGGDCSLRNSLDGLLDLDVAEGANIAGAFTSNGTLLTVDANDEDLPKNVSFSLCQWVDLVPLSGSLPVTVDVAEASRAGSIAGDVYVVNENGEETVYNDYSVVNETTNIYNDPISGTERPMDDWAYDYIERQYNITLEDGANVTIKYGDENIEIVEGDSIETLNYGSGSSGEGGGGDDSGGGIGDAIANLFTVLGEIILGLITAFINLATKALDALKGLFDLFGQLVETITGFFGGFTDFLAGVFPFLPEETFTIFNFGLILLLAATVFRKFLK